MTIRKLTVKHGMRCFYAVGLIFLSLVACSQKNRDKTSPVLPTDMKLASSQKDFYRFKLEQEFGNGIVQAADWAPDGHSFALATSTQVDIYDSLTLEVIDTIDTGQWNQEIAYSPDGKILAIGGVDRTIQLWAFQSKELLHSLVSTGPQPSYGNYLSFSFSQDGQKLVSLHYQTVYLWDVSSGEMLESFPGHIDKIHSVALSPDGKIILAAGSSRIFARDISTRELLYPPIEVTEDITSIYFAPNGNEFFTIQNKWIYDSNSSNASHYESRIARWNLSNGKILEEYPISKDYIGVTDVNREKHIFILGEESGFRGWDFLTHEEVFSLTGQTGSLNSIVLSPDGEKLITVGDDFGNGLTQLWDLTNRQAIKTFDHYSFTPASFKLSPDEKLVAVVGRNRITRVLDVSTGEVLYTLSGGGPLAFSPDSKTIAYTSGFDHLVLANAENGENLPIPSISCTALISVVFSPDNDIFAFGGDPFSSGGNPCNLQIRDTQTGELVKDLNQIPGNDYLSYDDLMFSPDGKRLLLAGYRLKMLDVETGKSLLEEDADYGSYILAFSLDGRYLAISSHDAYGEKEIVQVRDAVSGQVVWNIRTLQDNIQQMAFGSDGRTLMIVGESVEFWDAWNGRPLADAKLTDNPPVGVALAKDGQSLILVDDRGKLQRWSFQPDPQFALGIQSTPTTVPTLTATPEIPQIELVKVGEVGKGYASQVTYSPDGTIAALIENNTLRWFDTKSLQELGSLKVGETTGDITISPDNKIAVIDGYIGAGIIDLESRQVLGRVSGGNGSSFGYTFSKDSQYMAYTIGDRTTGGPYHSIGLWSVSTGSDAFPEYGYFPTLLEDRYHRMSAPAISPDVKLVAAGHSDKRVYVWNLRTGETRFILEGHGAEVNSVDFSPDGRWIASGSDDGTVRLWDSSNGNLIRVITGFPDDVWYVRFINGRSLQVYTADWQEYLVNLSSQQVTYQAEVVETPDPFQLQQYQQGFATGSSSIFSEVLFSPDGKTLATASQNVLLWDVATQKLLAVLNNPSGGLLRGMVFNGDGSRLAVTTIDEHVLVWDTKTAERIFSKKSSFLTGASVYYGIGDTEWGPARSRSPVAEQGLAFSPAGNLLAFGNDNVIEIWNVEGNEKVGELINPQGYFATQVSYSKDGKRLYAIINRNRVAQIWDVGSKELIREVDLPDVDPNAFSAVALHGSLFARNNLDEQGNGRIEVWDLGKEEFQPIFTDSASNEPMMFSSDGKLLLTFGDGSRMDIWSTSTGGLVYQTRLDFYAGGISLSPDTKYLAVGHAGKASIFDFDPVLTLAEGPNPQALLPQATPTPAMLAWPTPTAIPTFAKRAESASDSIVIDSTNAPDLREKNRFGKGTIEQVDWSKNEDSIIVTGSMGVSEYDVDPLTGKLISTLEREYDGWAYHSITLPDDRILSTVVAAGRVYVRDATTGDTLADLEGGGEPALSPDGTLLVYLNPDGQLEVWDISNKRSVVTLESYSHYSLRPVFSPDGQWVAAVQSLGSRLRYDDSIRVWDAHTGKIVNALAGPDNNVTNMSFSADGQFLVAAAGGSAWVWDMRPGVVPEELKLYQVERKNNLNIYLNTVTAAALSPDHLILAVGTSEHTLRLYDRKTQTMLRELDGHAASIQQLRFSSNGQGLISVDRDGTLVLWDVSSGEQLTRLDDHSGPIQGMIGQLDGNLIAWGEGTAWEIDPDDARVLHTTHIESTGSILAASPAGDLLAVYEPFSVSLLDARSGTLIQKLEGEAEDPFVEYQFEGSAFRRFYTAAFDRDGTRLVTAGTGGVWYYDTASMRLLQQYPGNNAQKISISPDGQWILTSLDEQINPVSVYDLQSGNELFSLGNFGRSSNFPQSVFSSDGRWVATIQFGWETPDQLIIYDTVSKQEHANLALDGEVRHISLAFNPLGDLIAVGREDGAILLISIDDREVVTTLDGHHGAVGHLLFSPDGKLLFSAGADGTIRSWELP